MESYETPSSDSDKHFDPLKTNVHVCMATVLSMGTYRRCFCHTFSIKSLVFHERLQNNDVFTVVMPLASLSNHNPIRETRK